MVIKFQPIGIPNPWNLQDQLQWEKSTGSSTSMRHVRQWLEDCTNNHPSCGSPIDPVLPSRVLDLGPEASTTITLWEPMGKAGRYVCLSYCWGQSEFTVTTQGNLKDHFEKGIELKDLPRTFQDAVKVARELKVRYLWIDALCIIQNEDNHDDWKRECGNMANIYCNSYLTLAATWANSANGGCFATPKPGVVIGPIMMHGIDHFPNRAIPKHSADFPLLTRAWTYQERMLAPRVLYFGRQEILKFNFHNQIVMEDSSRLWRQMVVQYSPLQLTYPSDKLPALSGLAQAMKLRNQENYLAGLWKDTLLLDMCWTRGTPKQKEPHQPRWRAPSWSWASIDGPITYWQELYVSGLSNVIVASHAQVREAKCTPAGPSLTGEVKDGVGVFAAIVVLGREVIFHGLVVKPHGQGAEMTRIGLVTSQGYWKDGDLTFHGCEKQMVKIV
ncbi:hypothetical protein ACJZ2D_013268 [Fusarium nematophilum]